MSSTKDKQPLVGDCSREESKRDRNKTDIPRATDTQRNKRSLYLLLITIFLALVKYKIYDSLSSSKKILTNDSSTVDETLRSMLSIESRVKINKELNVAVGLGSCLDIFVSSKDLILEQYEAPTTQIHHENIRTQDELNEVLAYFFVAGAAAERYIDNTTLFGELIKKAESAKGSRKAIGGNAAVMAKRFVLEGLDKVMLGTQHSRSTTDHYTAKMAISGPIVDQDDVHICIEYPAGEKWGNFVAPRANRLIIHSDSHNPSLRSMDNFIERLEMTRSLDLLVIGGLQMMDNSPIPIEERASKLEKLSAVLERKTLNKPKVHLELASFTEEALLAVVRDTILPHVHSLGMNEQELPTLLNYLSEGGVNIRSEAYPRVATTLDQMRQLYQLGQGLTNGHLSRIHTHTLAFQAIMTRVGSEWKNSLTSSVKAALTAHRYTCGSDKIDMAKAKLIMDESYTTSKSASRRRIPFNPKHPVVCWEEDIVMTDETSSNGNKSNRVETIEICVAPVLVCTKVIQTGGAGDNVSAAGLIFQL